MAAPSRARATAVALPNPDPAPVTSAGTDTSHTTGGHPVYEAPISTVVDTARVPHGGLQSTSTQGKPGAEPEQNGIPVSTNPTYRDDMKKEGY